MVTESSNTRVSTSKHGVTNATETSNCKRVTNNKLISKALDSTQVALSDVTHDTSTISNTVQTVSPVNIQGSELNSKVNKCTDNSSDSNLDKYDLDLRFRPRHRETVARAKFYQLFKNWDNQTVDKYGFIPLLEMVLPDENRKNSSLATIFDVYKSIIDTHTHNFLEAQIEIKSQLNPDAWDRHLQNYWDKQLPLLIRYGFPPDFNSVSPLHHEETNHASAKLFVKDVLHYLQEEASFKAILGPFDAPPIENLHISPFMTRPKPSSDHRRVIIDLSFPKGQSVNHGVSSEKYLDTSFILFLPTIDNVTQKNQKIR